jgi:uncharacterized protein with NRDE domain
VCTLVALHRVHPRFELLVLANRDELYARRATAASRHGDALYGVDLEKGGTWMGATRSGLFVGLTNQRSHHGPDRGLRSRGEVVRAALEAASVDAVDALVDSLDGREHNGFNLLYGDGDRLCVAYSRESERHVERERLPPGLWVLPNDRIDAPFFEWKTARARSLVQPLVSAPWETLREALPRVLADHEREPLERIEEPPPGSRFDRAFVRELTALCIHTPVYGTCSSVICALASGRVEHYLSASAAPCRGGSFEELAPLLDL